MIWLKYCSFGIKQEWFTHSSVSTFISEEEWSLLGGGGGDNLGVFYYFSASEFWPDKYTTLKLFYQEIQF